MMLFTSRVSDSSNITYHFIYKIINRSFSHKFAIKFIVDL